MTRTMNVVRRLQINRNLSPNFTHTYNGHGDARASQRYAVMVAKASAPDQYVPLEEVNCDGSDGGQEQVRMKV
jgi:hypothetical protein